MPPLDFSDIGGPAVGNTRLNEPMSAPAPEQPAATSNGPVRAPAGASGYPIDVEDRAVAIYNGLLDRGVRPSTALGVAANGVVESKADPYSNRSSSGAAGTFQWVGSRLRMYQDLHGHDPEDGDLNEHLDHLVWENQHQEAPAWNRVLRAPDDPVSQAMAFRTAWERPGRDPAEVAREEDLAAGAARQLMRLGLGGESTQARQRQHILPTQPAQKPQQQQPTSGPLNFDDIGPKTAGPLNFDDIGPKAPVTDETSTWDGGFPVPPTQPAPKAVVPPPPLIPQQPPDQVEPPSLDAMGNPIQAPTPPLAQNQPLPTALGPGPRLTPVPQPPTAPVPPAPAPLPPPGPRPIPLYAPQHLLPTTSPDMSFDAGVDDLPQVTDREGRPVNTPEPPPQPTSYVPDIGGEGMSIPGTPPPAPPPRKPQMAVPGWAASEIEADGQTVRPPPQSYAQAVVNAGLRDAAVGSGTGLTGTGEAAHALRVQEARRQIAAMDLVDKGDVPGAVAGLGQFERGILGTYISADPETRARLRAETVIQTPFDPAIANLRDQARAAGLLDYLDLRDGNPIPPERQQFAKDVQNKLADATGVKPNMLTRAGARVTTYGLRTFPVSEEQKGLGTEVAGAIGGLLPIAAAGIVGGVVGGPPGAIAATLPIMGAQAFDSTLKDGLRSGLLRTDAERVAGIAALTNMGIMALPVGRAVQMAPEMAAPLTKALMDVAKHGAEFASFNALSKAADNFVRQWYIDPKQDIMEGVGEAAVSGFVAGSVMRAPFALKNALPPIQWDRSTLNLQPRTAEEMAGFDEAQRRAAEDIYGRTNAYWPNTEPSRYPMLTGPAEEPERSALDKARDLFRSGAARPGPRVTPAPTGAGIPFPASAGAPEHTMDEGTTPSTPEPRTDLTAQIDAMGDKDNPKDAVWVTKADVDAGKIPKKLPTGTMVVTTPSGTLLTTNSTKMREARIGPVTDAMIGRWLGYPETKDDAIASGAPNVVQAKDKDGNVVAGAVTSPEATPATTAAVGAQQPEGGSTEIKTPTEAQDERGDKVAKEEYDAAAAAWQAQVTNVENARAQVNAGAMSDNDYMAHLQELTRLKSVMDAAQARLNGAAPPVVSSFTTAKGSTYDVHVGGTTTRNKSFHPEHGAADQGPQPRSQGTVYVTPEQANVLGEVQTQGGGVRGLALLPDGRVGVMYHDGPNAGKVEERTVVQPQTEPAVGLLPVEVWNNGTKVHFGNPITEVRAAPASDVMDPLTKRVHEIADEWEKLGDPKMADAIRAGIRMKNGQGQVTPDGLAFQEKKLADKKASMLPDQPKPKETFSLDQFMRGGPGVSEAGWMRFLGVASDEAKALADETEKRAQGIVDQINALGLTRANAHENSVEGARLKAELSGLLGTFSRFTHKEVARAKGYKNHKPADHEDAKQELIKDLRGEQAPAPAPAPPSSLDARLDAMASEATRIENQGVRRPEDLELHRALRAVSGMAHDVDAFRGAIIWGRANGREDIVQAALDRARRFADRPVQEPGLPPGHPNYDSAKARLADLHAQALRDAEELERLAKPAPAPQPAPADWTLAGKNHAGEDVYKNADGAHSVVENGVRVTEPVEMRPVRRPDGGVQHVAQIKPVGSKDPRFEVVKPGEKPAETPKTPLSAVEEYAAAKQEYDAADAAHRAFHPTIEAARDAFGNKHTMSEADFLAIDGHHRKLLADFDRAEARLRAATENLPKAPTAPGGRPPRGGGPRTPRPAPAPTPAPAPAPAPEPAPAPTPKPAPKPKLEAGPEDNPELGANNTIFTKEAADKAADDLNKLFGTFNSGFNPDMMAAGFRLAGYYIEAGIRKFVDFARAMIKRVGDRIIPVLKSLYRTVRDFPGVDTNGMDHDDTVVDAELKKIEDEAKVRAEEAANGPGDEKVGGSGEPETTPGGGSTGEPTGEGSTGALEGASPEDVRGPGEGGAGDTDGTRPGPQTVPVEETVHPGGDATDGRGGGGDEGMAPDGAGGGSGGPTDHTPTPTPSRPNFHIEDPDRLIGGPPKVRFERNKQAIETLRAIQLDEHDPTQAELETLAGYTGWGSFGQELFDGTWERPKPQREWRAEDQWLREHLGEEDWKSAQRSIENAHYTDPPTVQAMWDMAQQMGFKGGRILEPSMGIGNFFGLMPRDIMANSDLTGIELDRVTGAMAKLLYPHANIQIKGYEESQTPDGFYDMVIGNWPFSAQSPPDRRYSRLQPTLHNYFFLKALDQTRPGGIVMGITSAGTMDSVGNASRLAMANKGELIGAFRLPTGAFQRYAGTKVVTDLLIFRKRAEPPANVLETPWLDSSKVDFPDGSLRVNNFFQAHPQDVLGRMDYGHGTTTFGPGLLVHRPDNYPALLAGLASRVPADAYVPVTRGNEPRFITNNTTDRQNSVVIGQDSKLYQVQGERLALLEDIHRPLIGGTRKEVAARLDQVTRMVGLRKAYGELIDAERAGAANAEQLRTALASQYSGFLAAHGKIGPSAGLRVLDKVKDPAAPILEALERPDGSPSRILTEPTVRSPRSIENPSVADAYVMARNEHAIFDMDRVAELAKLPRDDVIKHLVDTGAVVRTPGGGFEPADSYLSGNVRRKLREAQQALNEGDEAMRPTVEALTARIPPTVPYHRIDANLGATWVGSDAYRTFISELLGVGQRGAENIKVTFVGSRWKVVFDDGNYNRRQEATRVWGTNHYRFDKLLDAALGNKTITIKYRDDDGEHVDVPATEEVNEKIAALRDRFKDWAWADPDRKIVFERAYNEVMNAIAKPSFDGSFMDMSGMALHRGDDPFALRQHQVNAIWRGVLLGRGLFAHEVGTGKTYTMGGIAVEGRRYGVHRKPMILAHNANSAAVAREIQEMYPGANVLYVDNLKPENVRTTLYRIANEDWDAVVMPHSVINKLTLKQETLMELAAEQIAELENEAIEAALEAGANLTPEMMDHMATDPRAARRLRDPTAKELVKQRNAIIAKIQEHALAASREGAIMFEDLGVDALMIDEAHEFKKPPIATQMKIKGLNTKTSDRSIQVNFLTGYVRKTRGGPGVYLFTGTPITNTLNEIYNLSRYFMESTLRENHIEHWDAWFNTFAEGRTEPELTAAGTYVPITRLARFANGTELARLMSEFTDVVRGRDMPEFVPRATADGKTLASPDLTDADRDYLVNGRTEKPIGRPYKKIISDTAEMSPDQRRIREHIAQLDAEFRAADGRQRKIWMDTGDEHSPLLTEQNAPKASMDARMYDPDAPDWPDSKVNRAVRNVTRIFHEEPLAAQAIFVDSGYAAGVSGRGRPAPFILVRDLVDKLVAGGIPRNQIKIVAGRVKAEQKKEIADMMNDGRLRVVIGLSSTIGVGVNMQTNLRAMHHLDAPWRPGDMEQRNGRGERQGNKWNTVLEYRYITEGIDGRRWQVLAKKQKFINDFIENVRDNTGKRLEDLEGDAADLSDDEDILQTLAVAAGDPRILLLEKYKADVTRLEKRERMHEIGRTDAAAAVETRIRDNAYNEKMAEGYRDRAQLWNAAAERATEASIAAGAARRMPNGSVQGPRWYEANVNGHDLHTGDDIQAAIDQQVLTLVRGEGPRTLATINGFEVRADWSKFVSATPEYSLVAPNGDKFATMEAPTMPRIIRFMNDQKGWADIHFQKVLEGRASLDALRRAATDPFPHHGALVKKRQQRDDLQDDLDMNPEPPPAWFRNGAPVDTDIYVNGQPRTVRGHKMADDFLLSTDEGDVPYLQANDENGLRIYTVHPPPDKKQKPATPDWAQPIVNRMRGETLWTQGQLLLMRAKNDAGVTIYHGVKDHVGATRQDVEEYSGQQFTPADLRKLRDAKRQAMKLFPEAPPPVPVGAPAQGWNAPIRTPLGFSGNEPGEPMFALRVPLYSAVERAVGGLKQAKGTGEQMLAQVLKTPGVRAEEVKAIGLDDWLKGQKNVTREQIADYVRANQIEVHETIHHNQEAARQQINSEIAALGLDPKEAGLYDVERAGGSQDLIERYRKVVYGGDPDNPRPQYDDPRYREPGGKYYHEGVFTLPPRDTAKPWEVFDPTDGRAVASFATEEEAISDARQRGAHFDYAWAQEPGNPALYTDSHWPYINTMGHARWSTYIRPDGTREMRVHEVQSGWHQAGQKGGYQDPDLDKKVADIERQQDALLRSVQAREPGLRRDVHAGQQEADAYRKMTTEEQNLYGRLQMERGNLIHQHAILVPDAPFKTSWRGLIMRRLIKYAVDNGFDHVTWTPGNVKADHYGQRKPIDTAVWHGDGNLSVVHQGDYREQIIAERVPPEKLANHLNPELAARLSATEPGPEGERVLTGLNGEMIGGHGMREHYDKRLPSEVDKIVKPFGAKVVRTEVGSGVPEDPQIIRVNDGFRVIDTKSESFLSPLLEDHYTAEQWLKNHHEPSLRPAFSLEITPALRHAVATEGLPLFARQQRNALPAEIPNHEAASAMAEAVNHMLGGKGRVEVVGLDTPGAGLRITLPDGSIRTADAITLGRLIRVAFDGGRTFQHLNHEVIHALRNMGVFTPQEWRLLEAQATREGWADRYGIRETYAGASEGLILEEAIAHRAGEAAGETPAQAGPLLTRIADKLRAFFARLRNWLQGHGYQTADDILGKVRSGEIGAREPGSGMVERGSTDMEVNRDVMDMYQPDRPQFALRPTPPPGVTPHPTTPRARLVQAVKDARDAVAEHLDTKKLVEDWLTFAAPMRLGPGEPAEQAFTFANQMRLASWSFGKLAEAIRDNFSIPERWEMGRAHGEQSVFEHKLKRELDALPAAQRPAYEAAARSRFDALKTGHAGLSPEARHVVENLSAIADQVWADYEARGMVYPGAEGWAHWMPRQFVIMDPNGRSRRIVRDDAILPRKPQPQYQRMPGAPDLRPYATNLHDDSPGFRNHEEVEESLDAIRRKYGPNVYLVNDIMALVGSLRSARTAINGHDLIAAIKAYGSRSGTPTVIESAGGEPEGGFTLAGHKSMYRYAPTYVDDGTGTGKMTIAIGPDGKPIFRKVPIYVAQEFAGPLKAVFTSKPPALWKALMVLKLANTHMVLISPFSHLMVELSRALPLRADHKMVVRTLGVGRRARYAQHPGIEQLILNGMAPISGGWIGDPVSLADEANYMTPFGALGRVVIQARDALARTAGKMPLAGPLFEKIVRRPTQTLLWNRVLDMQIAIGLAVAKEHMDNGWPPTAAYTAAAQIANRYAGALPPEGMSRLANMLENLLEFSRSYTGGNVGLLKDAFTGAAKHVLDHIGATDGPEWQATATAWLKSKARKTTVLDMVMYFGLAALMQHAFHALYNQLTGTVDNESLVDGYIRRFHTAINHITEDPVTKTVFAPWTVAQFIADVMPMADNEIGKTNRVRLFKLPGTAQWLYMRPFFGKVGEDIFGWFLDPREASSRKLSSFGRMAIDFITKQDAIGRPIMRPGDDQGIQNAWRMTSHLLGIQFPIGAPGSAAYTALGRPGSSFFGSPPPSPKEQRLAQMQTLGTLSGIGSFSRGNRLGPRAGEESMRESQIRFDLAEHMPQVEAFVAAGRRQDALDLMKKLGVQPHDAVRVVKDLSPTNQRNVTGVTPPWVMKRTNIRGVPAEIQRQRVLENSYGLPPTPEPTPPP